MRAGGGGEASTRHEGTNHNERLSSVQRPPASHNKATGAPEESLNTERLRVRTAVRAAGDTGMNHNERIASARPAPPDNTATAAPHESPNTERLRVRTAVKAGVGESADTGGMPTNHNERVSSTPRPVPSDEKTTAGSEESPNTARLRVRTAVRAGGEEVPQTNPTGNHNERQIGRNGQRPLSGEKKATAASEEFPNMDRLRVRTAVKAGGGTEVPPIKPSGNHNERQVGLGARRGAGSR